MIPVYWLWWKELERTMKANNVLSYFLLEIYMYYLPDGTAGPDLFQAHTNVDFIWAESSRACGPVRVLWPSRYINLAQTICVLNPWREAKAKSSQKWTNFCEEDDAWLDMRNRNEIYEENFKYPKGPSFKSLRYSAFIHLSKFWSLADTGSFFFCVHKLFSSSLVLGSICVVTKKKKKRKS